MKEWCVYVLKCSDDSMYCGCTNDLHRRFGQHSSGTGAKYTRSRLPVALIASWSAESRSDALRKEAAFKRLSRKEKIEWIRNLP